MHFATYSTRASRRPVRDCSHAQKRRSLVIKHQTETRPQTVPAAFVCSGQAVLHEGMCVMCPEAKLGVEMGLLCNCMDVMQQDIQNRQLMTTAL